MSEHFTDKELNGYIHRTLSDVQRETMGRHLNRCADCGARLQRAEQWQRQITNDLDMALRYERPSADMNFGHIQEKISRKRKFAFFRFHTVRMTSTVGKFALAVLGIAFAMTMFSLAGRGAPLVQANPAPAMFPESWEDPAPFQPVLVADEQVALQSLETAPIYHLDMTIDENLQRVFGRQQLRYVNTTSDSLMEMYFSLFPNLTDGRLQVSGVLVDGQPVHYEVLEDLFLRIDLPYRLRAMDTAVVQIEFRLDVGHTRQIFNGALVNINDTLSLTQFHPQLVPYDADRGWDLSIPVHGITNANNSYYRVRVTAPEGLNIITSGSMIDQNMMGNGQSSHTFSAGPVGSFYLIASEKFDVRLSESVGETTIYSYATAAHLQADAQMALDVAVAAVRIFNEQFGTYPFAELDVVSSPALGLDTSGMNFSGVALVTLYYGRENLEQSVVSQVSGQWFMPLVVQSYQQNPWLADGLATYATHYYYDAVDGYTAVHDVRENWQQNWGDQSIDSIGLAVDDFATDDFTKAMHGHTPLFLSWLAQTIGETTFTSFLRDYYSTYRWSGASANEFADLLATYCDCDLSPIFTNTSPSPVQFEYSSDDPNRN